MVMVVWAVGLGLRVRDGILEIRQFGYVAQMGHKWVRWVGLRLVGFDGLARQKG